MRVQTHRIRNGVGFIGQEAFTFMLVRIRPHASMADMQQDQALPRLRDDICIQLTYADQSVTCRAGWHRLKLNQRQLSEYRTIARVAPSDRRLALPGYAAKHAK
jgi:hypothetical protein